MKALIPKLIPVLLASFSLNVLAATTRYVDLNSPSPTPPYTSWITAATNIQLAVNLSVLGDTILVTNGIYETGRTTFSGSNRVAVTRPITVSSVNGPSVTVIRGYQTPGTPNDSSAIRCVYLTSGATLSGFTLTNGGTFNGGAGGVLCQSSSAMVTNCTIIGNPGGGAANGTLFNCLLTGNTLSGASGSILVGCTIVSNSTSGMGGGVTSTCMLTNCVVAGNYANTSGGGCYRSTLVNCTVTGNRAHKSGGGTFGCVLVNSIIYYNDVDLITDNSTNHLSNISAINCCTIPLPTASNSFSNPPIFIDQIAGNYRLQLSSPCINAGNNSHANTPSDLDGNPRIVGGTVDIGAYEFQSPSSLLSYAWAQQNGLPTDGSADFTDADGDGMSNYGEWRSDTNPTNSVSSLRMVNATNNPSGAEVTWQSVSTRNYWLERATNLGTASPFQTIATNIAGVAGVKSFTDTSATNAGPYFYRVGVQ